MKFMKKVLVKAYARKNLGDDLFLEVLFNRYPQALFYMEASDDYNEIFKRYHNVRIIREPSKNTLLRYFDYILRHFFPFFFRIILKQRFVSFFKKSVLYQDIDAFVLIGGSMFMQHRSLPVYDEIEFYRQLEENNPNISVFILGANFGPFKDDKYLKGYTDVFSKAKDVCFRESYSKGLFRDLNNVRFAPDIVFSASFKVLDKKKDTIGISIISPENRDGMGINECRDYYEKNAELISNFVKDGKTVFLFSFCKEEGDEDSINKIVCRLAPDILTKVQTCFYSGEIESFLKTYSQVETMLCGRFHSIILSLLFEQSIFPIIYSSKMTNVLRDLGYKGSMVDLPNLGLIKYEDVKANVEINVLDISNAKEGANIQFQELDIFLMDN